MGSVNTGDIITPKEISFNFPISLENRTVPVLAYPLETIIAEKYETIIRRNVTTTRARDFYDLFMLFDVYRDGINVDTLALAVNNTAEKRGSTQFMKDAEIIIAKIENSEYLQNIWAEYSEKYEYAENVKYEKLIMILREINRELSGNKKNSVDDAV